MKLLIATVLSLSMISSCSLLEKKIAEKPDDPVNAFSNIYEENKDDLIQLSLYSETRNQGAIDYRTINEIKAFFGCSIQDAIAYAEAQREVYSSILNNNSKKDQFSRANHKFKIMQDIGRLATIHEKLDPDINAKEIYAKITRTLTQ